MQHHSSQCACEHPDITHMSVDRTTLTVTLSHTIFPAQQHAFTCSPLTLPVQVVARRLPSLCLNPHSTHSWFSTRALLLC